MTTTTGRERTLLESYCADITGESYESTCRPLDQIWFNAPAFRTAEEQTRAGGRAFAYYFTVEASLPPMRSGHAVELSTLFNHAEETQFTGRRFDETFGKTLRRMWVQFAKTGDPSLPAEISPDGQAKVWPLYDTENKYAMIFEEFNVRAEKESVVGAVDWERTYPLTDYYVL